VCVMHFFLGISPPPARCNEKKCTRKERPRFFARPRSILLLLLSVDKCPADRVSPRKMHSA